MKYPISPVTFTPFGGTETTLTSIYMTVTYQIGMTEMPVPYSLLDSEDRAIVSDLTFISEAELDQWGTDNMYIVNLVADAAGVTVI